MNLTKAWAAQLDDYTIDLAWSPDGRMLASASAAGPITLFDGTTGAKLHELPGHADGTNAVTFAPGAARVATGAPASAADPVPALAQPHTFPSAAGPPVAGVADPGPASARPAPTLTSGGQDGKVRFWDASTGQQAAEADIGRGAWVELLQWRPLATSLKAQAPDPSMLAVAAGRTLTLLRGDGSVAHSFPPAPKTLSALAWQPHGGAIAVAHFGGVCLWDADDFHAQREYAYGSAIHALVWSPDGRWLVAGAQDNAVHLWIPEEDQEFHMSGYETKVRELSFSPDSRWLATGGARDACVWDCSGAGPEGREPLALPHTGRVCAVAYQRAHGFLATAAADHEVALWDPPRPQPLVASVKLTAPASKLAWSPDDTQLAIGSQQGGVLVLQVGT
jgi:WD40 repeat protein